MLKCYYLSDKATILDQKLPTNPGNKIVTDTHISS